MKKEYVPYGKTWKNHIMRIPIDQIEEMFGCKNEPKQKKIEFIEKVAEYLKDKYGK